MDKDTVYEGAKAVKMVGVDAEKLIYKTGTAQTDGAQIIYIRPEVTTAGNTRIYIKDANGNTAIEFISNHSDDTFRYRSGGSEPEITSFTPGNWYKIKLEWRSSDGYVSLGYNQWFGQDLFEGLYRC